MSPQVLDDAFNRVSFDRELVFKFFIAFSLVEKALKQTSFRRVDPGGDVHPNWEVFSQTIDGNVNYQANPQLATAVAYLLQHPPGKQVWRNNQLAFEQTQRPPGLSDTEWLSLLVRRVRNNLFHGSKFSFDRHRDTLLIQFSLVILEEWALCHPDILVILQSIQ